MLFVVQREGSQNKMNRRKRATEKRTTIAIPSASVKNTVGFAVRIHKGRHTSPEIKKELQSLGLYHKYNGVFINLNQENIGKFAHSNPHSLTHLNASARLKPLDSYVAYGYISSQLVHELIHRRAFVMLNGEKKNLSNNLIIEQLFGEQNVLCLNDLAHELYTVGPSFANILSVLATFNLASPTTPFEKQVLEIFDEVESKGGFLDGDEMDVFLNKIL